MQLNNCYTELMLSNTQQEKVIVEIATYLESTTIDTLTTKYDRASLEFLRALNNIFEQGLLSHYKVTDGDATPLTKMREGIEYFEEWCDEAIENGKCACSVV